MLKKQSKKYIVGIGVRTNNQNLKPLQQLWERFDPTNLFATYPEHIGQDLYGVYTNYESDMNGDYDYYIGIQVPSLENIAPDHKSFILPEGYYAYWEEKGNPSVATQELWKKVWTTSLPRCYDVDYETYHTDGTISLSISVSQK